jgi:acetoin utilization deacetylase AcuC-like enzyme
MDVYYSKRQLEHRPQQIMLLGKLTPPVENPDRLEALARRLKAAGLTETAPADHGRDAIEAVHSADYVDFLASSYERWASNPKAGPEVLPNTHPYRGRGSALGSLTKPPCSVVNAQAGWYIGDLNCAIGAGTWGAVYESAQAALSAARAIIDGGSSAFALCRPPGHHAFADRASGFCFLNNAAIAANLIGARAGQVAILDFDTHHGDGTQALFYDRKDVLFASVHTDPTIYYPYFSGYAEERGEGEGYGANVNVPLAPGSCDETFLDACRHLVEAARAHKSEVLVVSAGWDAHRDDPLSLLDVSTDAFARVGELLAELQLPTLIVQEGGYSLEASEAAAAAFIGGFCSRHKRT